MLPLHKIHRVVLVVLDGLRPDAIDAFSLRHWQRLERSAACSRAATTVTPSVTAAAMASLLTGARPSVHGLTSDRFHLPRRRGELQPLPQHLAHHGLLTAAFVRELPPLFRGVGARLATRLGVATPSFRGRSAPEIVMAARGALSGSGRGLVLLHLPDADDAGHTHGWMSEEYGAASRRLDESLGMIAALAGVGEDPGTLLVAMADHGGGGVVPSCHEAEHPLNRTIPMMFAGCAVTPERLPDGVSLLDVPPTICEVLGVPVHPTYVGRPLGALVMGATVAA